MINKDADLFGFISRVDGATTSRNLLLDVLVSGKNLLVSVLELFDCRGHLYHSGKKYGSFICRIFLQQMGLIDPDKSLTDVLMFDGAVNVQLAVELFKIYYQNLTVMRGVEHTVTLFFNDV